MASFDAHALVIGISAYQHITPLAHKPDAEDMAEVLADPALCAYPKENVRVLLQGEATRARILAELSALARRSTADSTVFFFFSGHGGRAQVDGVETCFLLPVDTRDGVIGELASSAISGTELSAALRAVPASKVTVVLDCCNAAGVAEAKDGARDVAVPAAGATGIAALQPQISAEAVTQLARGLGRVVLAASRSDGSAYAMPQARNGIFTGHLLAGLRGEAQGVGGIIRILDLYTFVQERTRAEYAVQRPVFKAEIEENYPVGLYRGGNAPPTVLPAASDASTYDAFLSYSEDEAEWVMSAVVPKLEALGLKLCLEERDFRLGATRLEEMERAVTTSRYTVCVLSPSYLEGAFEDFQNDLAQFNAVESKKASFIPLLRKPCKPAMSARMTAMLDVTKERTVDAQLERLAVALREPPRAR